MRVYSDPERESDPHALPDVEVFYMSAAEIEAYGKDSVWFDADQGEYREAGWYYWFCFPGCMPDSDAIGPWDSAEAAIAHVREE